MDFNNRQYDPQIGRFLGVDPLAAVGGQDSYSPYTAMGNDPVGSTDPDGLMRNQTPRLNTFSHFVFFNIWAGFSSSTLDWIGLGGDGGYIDFGAFYEQQFGSGWSGGGLGGSVVTFNGESARAVMSLLSGSTDFNMKSGSLVINFSNGDRVTIGFDGGVDMSYGADHSYACENCSDMTDDGQSASIMKATMTIAMATIIAGGGPVDIYADGVAGAIVVGGAAIAGIAYLYENWDPLYLGMAGWMLADHRTAGEIIAQERKGDINREFPDQYRDKTLREIENAAKTDRNAKKALKLLKDGRFKK